MHHPVTTTAIATAVALVLLLGVAGCSSAREDSFVERSGSALVVDGEPFRFVGLNLYDAAASDRYSCRPQTRLPAGDLEPALERLRDESGATVLRFWAYQTYTNGGTDFSAVDAVVEAARRVGMRVMPVLEDGPGDCSTGAPDVPLDQTADDTWYTDGYRQPLGTARLSFRDYARVVAAHYADDPTVLGWTMVNEAETGARTDDGRSALVPFAEDVAGVIRSVDPHHLITLGTQGNGAPGGSGPDFEEVYALPGLDFAEVHDWPRNGSSEEEAMPGALEDGSLPEPSSGTCTSTSAPIACSFAIADQLGKPLVVGEMGITTDISDPESLARRARITQAKVSAAFAAGADGYVPWHASPAATDGYDILIFNEDPVLGVLRRSLSDS